MRQTTVDSYCDRDVNISQGIHLKSVIKPVLTEDIQVFQGYHLSIILPFDAILSGYRQSLIFQLFKNK
jgi:hypothetical protein